MLRRSSALANLMSMRSSTRMLNMDAENNLESGGYVETAQANEINEAGVVDDQVESGDETELFESELVAGESNAYDDREALVCPPNIEPDVFHSLPREMQLDVVNEYAQSQDLAAQLNGTSLDPEFLAALPEDMRREVIEHERMRGEQQTAPVDPSRAEEMDNASFIASLAPELRAEILRTADEDTINSLPPNLIA
jgi:Ubiquitin binding region